MLTSLIIVLLLTRLSPVPRRVRVMGVLGVVAVLFVAVPVLAEDEANEDYSELDSLLNGVSQPGDQNTPSEATAKSDDAQDDAQTESTDAAPDTVVRARPQKVLEEIVVTAQKRAEDIQDVPLSVTAIGGDEIVDKNMGDMNEVANYVPNLDVLAVPTFPSVYMRGLGSSYNRGFEQSVAILIDEVFYGRASYINQGLLDLAAIEVLRGPQGTLFGKNASAGAIHFRTAMPEDEFGFRGDVLTGERDLRRYRLSTTGPLSEDLSWRIALLHETRDGGVLNTTTGIDEENRDNQFLRMRLQWDAADQLSVGMTLNTGVIDQHGAGSQLIRGRDRHLAAMREFDSRIEDDPFNEQSSLDYPGEVARDTQDATLKIDWTLDNGHVLTSITNRSWLDEDVSFDADFSPVPFLILENNEDMRQFSQELRITSAPGKLEFVGGLFYLTTDLDATYDITNLLELQEILLITGEGERMLCVRSPNPEQCQNAVLDDSNSGQLAGQLINARIQAEGGASPVESSLTRFGQITDSAAIFGQATWHFTERWSATLGGRLNKEEKSLDVVHRLINHRTGGEGNAVLSGVSGLGVLPPDFPLADQLPIPGYALGPNPDGAIIFPIIITGDTQFSARRNRKTTDFSPKFSTQFDVTDASMAYLTVARGFKSGGFNAQPVNEQQLEFDEEEALTYELGYKSEWLDGAARFNVSVFHTEFDGLQVATFNGVSYVVGNAASATIQGIEYEGLLLTSQGFLLGLNGAFTDAKYDEFLRAPCAAEITDPPPCDLSGQRMRLVPELKSTFTAGWQGGLFNLPFTTHAGLTASYTDEVALATDLDPVDIRESGTTYGLQLGIRSPADTWHVTVFGDNITSHESLAGAQDTPGFRGTHFGGAYPAASYELEFGYRF